MQTCEHKRVEPWGVSYTPGSQLVRCLDCSAKLHLSRPAEAPPPPKPVRSMSHG